MDTLQMLYDSEISFEISCFWDGSFIWRLGDYANGYVAEGNAPNVEDAATQIADAAIKHFPESDFASKFGRTALYS